MHEIAKVQNAVDQSRFSVRPFEGSPCIHYDDLPLWRTAVGLDQLEIFLYDPKPLKDEGYSLFCRDSFGDIYTYGMWETLEDAKAWLDKPTRLY